MSEACFVIGGNGPSLAELTQGTILTDDTIIRVNSFFFEEQMYLGPRVDVAYVAGDPRVAPFVFATMKKISGHYDVQQWSALAPQVIKAGHKHLSQPFVPMRYRDDGMVKSVRALMSKYQAKPTGGSEAMFLAHTLGASRIVLAGIDHYADGPRYAFNPGRHQRDLLGHNIGQRPYDRRIHHPDLDRALIELMQNQPDVDVTLASSASGLSSFVDLAPVRSGTPVRPTSKPKTEDWVDWAGWYPISLLKLLRRTRGFQMRLTGQESGHNP